MTYWELDDEQERDGFTIRTYVAPEDFAPDFDDGEVLQGINDGRYVWFQVKVSAWKAGVELGIAYLGGCCYESTEEFIGDFYWEDMVEEAIAEAKKTIEELSK
jgi:hypothetical protein